MNRDHDCPLTVLPRDVFLIGDAAAAYRRFALSRDIAHEAVNVQAGIRARGTIHIQNVKGWHSRYLANYCAIVGRQPGAFLNSRGQRLFHAGRRRRRANQAPTAPMAARAGSAGS